MTTQAPSDPQHEIAWRRARRRVARDHHPDRGGDPGGYLSALREVDRRFGVDPLEGVGAAVPPGRLTKLRRLVVRRRRSARRRLRQVQQRLPRRVPGARRFTTL